MIKRKNKTKKSLGLYLHIPFCVKKCHYCDFLSFTNKDLDSQAYYIFKLIQELTWRSNDTKDYIVDSIFIGGGTPSSIPEDLIDELLDAVYALFSVSENTEITIETNPGTLDYNKLSSYKSYGINRLSMGVQSMNNDTLKYIGRIHDDKAVTDNFNDARKAGFDNINTDLIFGIPGQTNSDWLEDVDKILELNPEHISFYSLQVEEGTHIFNEIMEDNVTEVTDIEDRRMYHDALDKFEKSGYSLYEISNCAKPGYESVHNLKYWSMNDYLGIGLGAHSYFEGKRFCNTEDLNDYLSATSDNVITAWVHDNSIQDEISEYVFLGLRKTEGINLDKFESIYKKNFLDIYGHETEKLINRGLVEIEDKNLKLTALGRDLSNKVFVEYV